MIEQPPSCWVQEEKKLVEDLIPAISASLLLTYLVYTLKALIRTGHMALLTTEGQRSSLFFFPGEWDLGRSTSDDHRHLSGFFFFDTCQLYQ